jgi:hypothetical protein
MSTQQSLNGLRAIGVRLLIPYRGVWVADVELDLDLVSTAPTAGPALLLLSTGETLKGTIDPRGSSSFVGKASARVVGGSNGWDTVLPPLAFPSAVGIPSTVVYSATAASVLEAVVDPTPQTFAPDFIRTGGPASRVFSDRQWYVDPITGIANVAPWPPNVLDPGDTILDWDPVQQRAEIAGDDLILPGTVLTDPRFNGATYTVVDVEQFFTSEGSRTFAWCSNQNASRLHAAMGAAVRELARTAGLATYTYRFAIMEGSSAMALQAVTPGAPDLNPIDQWSGMAGLLGTLDPSTSLEIIVGFTADTPPQPYIASYSPKGLPLTAKLDASLEVDVGPSAAAVVLAGGGAGIARHGDTITITPAQFLAAGAIANLTTGAVTITANLQGTITTGSLKASSG